MDKIESNIVDFLKKYQMDYEDIDIEMNVKNFLLDMERGLAGPKSTLAMIPTYIEVTDEIPINKPVIVADAGGTHFRIATVYFNDQKKPIVKNQSRFSMPGVKHEISKDEFFKNMASYFEGVANAAKSIGFCFSYAVEMFPNKDGRLIRFSKEIKAKEVEGQMIGENLNRAMAEMKVDGHKNIVILNDTVATLLAGIGYKNRIFGGYIGFILGTGTNCSYIEKNSKIVKKKNLDLAKSQIINTESGGFANCQRGKLDEMLDKTTVNPGVYPFEKMVSGLYLGPIYLRTIHEACNEHMFSDSVQKNLWQRTELETKDMNEFMQYPYGDNPLAKACENGTKKDILTLYYIADRLTERAAKLAAINLSAVAIKSGQGTDPTRPVCIVAEGTTLYQMKGLKNRIEFYLKQYLEDKMGIYYEIINVDHATLIGAAIAGLTN